MSKPFDATLNSLIDGHAADWGNFFAARAGIPPGHVEPLDTNLSVTAQADKLFRIDGPTPAALHLEFESSGRLGHGVRDGARRGEGDDGDGRIDRAVFDSGGEHRDGKP